MTKKTNMPKNGDLWELWWAESTQSHAFFPEYNSSARATLEPDAELIWTCRAKSMDDALAQRDKHLGWSN